MAAHNVHLGEVVHHLKSGRVRRFKPQGEVYGVTKRGRIAKASELSEASEKVESLPVGGLAARIFIGLNVGEETKYTIQDVMRSTLKLRRSQGKRADGSFLAQMGIYQDTKGRVIEEPSVQVVLLDLEGTREKEWVREMLALGKYLRRKFHQETVIVEIQERGIAKAVYSVTA